MIKVLITGFTSNHGGIENTIYNYYNKLDKSEFKIDFLKRSPKKIAYEDEILNNKSRIFEITSYYKDELLFIDELVALLEKEKYNVIYCNLNSAIYISPLLAAKKYGKVKVIVHVHSCNSDKKIFFKLRHYINRMKLEKLGDYFFSCSDKAAKWFYSRRIRESSRFYVISNFINPEEFNYNNVKRIEIRKQLNINDSLLLGQVGRFSKNKNQIFSVKVLEKLLDLGIDAKLILIGKFDVLDRAYKYVTNKKIEDKVTFTGMIDNVEDYLNAMDCFIFPSMYEGFGNALVEAQLNGLPCLTSFNIDRKTNISGKVNYIKLAKGPKFWAKVIKEINNRNRENVSNIKEFDYSRDLAIINEIIKKI